MPTHVVGPIDLTGSYRLISGISVVARSDSVLQIGAEPPKWLILHHAPAGALQILRGLDGSARLADVLAAQHADPVVWGTLLTRLRDLGLLVAVSDWVFPGAEQDVLLDPERTSLVYRYGMGTARRLLARRHEALVVVRGSGRVASAIAALLAASGVGHVHQEPDRAVRSNDSSAALAAPGTFPAGDPLTRAQVLSGSGPSRRPDDHAAVLAAALRRISRSVRTHPPAAHQHPALVVLAGDIPSASWSATALLREQIPHLAVRTQLASVVVGPLVIPGRSACLLCVLRHRSAIDLGWTAFEAGLVQEPVRSPAALIWTAASLAAIDALTHLDGLATPSMVDGTVEWWAGELAPRRRTWSIHPDCECRNSTRPSSDGPNADESAGN